VEEVSVREARAAEPCVALDITRAFSVPDAAIDGFTLAWANAAAAMEKGSVVKTYSSVVGFLIEDGVVKGVRVRSARSAEEDLISCDYVINAAGAWAGEVASLAGQVIDLVPDRGTLMIFHHRLASRVLNRLRAPSDGDIFVPHGTVTIFGTTSKPAAGPDDLDVSPDEVLDLLEEGAPLVPSVKCARIIRAFAGVRPLYQPGAGQGREVTRGFTLIDHSESGLEGMISIVGGKLTTYRLMAQAASDLAAAKLRVAAPCMTALEPLKDPITMPISPDTSRIRLDDDLYFCECERVGPSRIESAADLLRKSMGSAGSEFSSGFIGDLRRLTRLGMGPCQGAFCTVRAAAYAHENIGISVEEGNRLIAEHARERWKGTRPVLWGAQARQAELARGIYQGLLNLHRAHKESHDL
jgi:glycerol-3-phosphate dehydrogenase